MYTQFLSTLQYLFKPYSIIILPAKNNKLLLPKFAVFGPLLMFIIHFEFRD